jgi:hypothetical protein
MVDTELKYFFTAFYRDGSYFTQNREDVSGKDPSRSAFYDVDHERLTAFSVSDAEHSYVVDLTSGSFIIDGVYFRMHDEGDFVGPLQLIFARRHWQRISVNQKDEKIEEDHRVAYRIGWRGSDARGHCVQRVMEID